MNIIHELHRFHLAPEEKQGQDGRYHTVYLIHFETGHFYVGKHTSDDLVLDKYFASGILPNFYREKGFSFERKIISFEDSADLAIDKETELLEDELIYYDEFCLNCYPGSPPDQSGCLHIHRDGKIKQINPRLLEYYLLEGWQQGRPKRIWVSNGADSTFILPEKIGEYLNQGWELGNVKARNRIWLKLKDQRKFVLKSEVQTYIDTGWVLQHNIQGYKVVIKDNSIRKVPPELLQQYLARGYQQASTVDGLVYITKDRSYRRVPETELQNFLNQGWEKGNNTTGRVYVRRGTEEKRVYPDEIPLGWEVGRIPKVYLNNGVTEKRIFEHLVDKINDLVTEGYQKGKLVRGKKTLDTHNEIV